MEKDAKLFWLCISVGCLNTCMLTELTWLRYDIFMLVIVPIIICFSFANKSIYINKTFARKYLFHFELTLVHEQYTIRSYWLQSFVSLYNIYLFYIFMKRISLPSQMQQLHVFLSCPALFFLEFRHLKTRVVSITYKLNSPIKHIFIKTRRIISFYTNRMTERWNLMYVVYVYYVI